MKKFLNIVGVLFLVFMAVMVVGAMIGVATFFNPAEDHLSKKSILELKLEGVILDPSEFLEDLREYRKDDKIKGVLIRIDSPGGVVAPSQELYTEIKRVRDEFKKPVVVSVSSLMASGAYYAGVGADKIIVNPGSMIGSIGVILEFVNLEKLYAWAKIERYALTTGMMKDAGAEYKPLSPEARKVFQSMIDNVYQQFVGTVKANRKIAPDVLTTYTDGRVMTGEAAVKFGFADEVGTYDDARKAIGKLTGLGDEPEMFEPPKKRRNFQDFLLDVEGRFQPEKILFEKWLRLKSLGAPLYIMPGVLPN